MKQIILFLLSVLTLAITANGRLPVKKLPYPPVTINVMVDAGLPDTLTLYYWNRYFDQSGSRNIPNRKLIATGRLVKFQFRIPAEQRCVYFCLYNGENKTGRNKQLCLYLAEPGDQVTISFKEKGISFTGKGSLKYQCKYSMDSAKAQWQKLWMMARSNSGRKRPPDSLRYYSYPNDLREGQLFGNEKFTVAFKILNAFKNRITPFCYEVMKADLVGKNETDNLYAFVFYSINFSKDFQRQVQDSIQKKLKAIYTERIPISAGKKLSEKAILVSADYKSFLVDQAYQAKRLFNIDGYTWLKNNFKGELRDRLLVAHLMRAITKSNENQLKEALTVIQSPYCRNILRPMLDHQRKGAPAFKFTLPDSSGHLVTLDDFKGRTVVLDFWFTGCSGCIAMARLMPSIAGEFRDKQKVVFVSISTDKDSTTWKKSITSGLYTGKDYINLYTKGMGEDHPIIKYYRIQFYPKMLIIDPEGRIFSTYEPVSSDSTMINKYINLIKQSLLP